MARTNRASSKQSQEDSSSTVACLSAPTVLFLAHNTSTFVCVASPPGDHPEAGGRHRRGAVQRPAQPQPDPVARQHRLPRHDGRELLQQPAGRQRVRGPGQRPR